MNEQSLYINNYHNPELIRKLLSLMGIAQPGDEDGIYNGASVEKSLAIARIDFGSVHDMLHTAIFLYVLDLFEHILPIELLDFSLKRKGLTCTYRVPRVILTQSSWLAEVLVLAFDSIYREGAEELPAPFAKEIADVINGRFGLSEVKRGLSKVAFGPITSLEGAVLRVAAVTILLSEKPLSERAFSITDTHNEEVTKIQKELQEIMATKEGGNYLQLNSLISRVALILQIASDQREEFGLNKLSFHTWLREEPYSLQNLTSESLQDMVLSMQHEIASDLANVNLNEPCP